jgi:hypothetical protein
LCADIGDRHIFTSRVQDPSGGFLSQLANGVNRDFQALLPSIFNFVVAYAAERLAEHHHSGNARVSSSDVRESLGGLANLSRTRAFATY